METVTLPTQRLSPDPEYDRRLRILLERLLPPLLEHAQSLKPRFLALMGSAAVGEAVAVSREGQWLPLSDLDLGLVVTLPATRACRDRLQGRIDALLHPLCEELQVCHSPVDIGVVPLFYLARLPVTLEIGELIRRPVVLWGDPLGLRGLDSRPRPFEPLRLFANRLVELLRPAGSDAKGSTGWLTPLVDPPQWPAAPAEGDWQNAYRWAKLQVDMGKVFLAAAGLFEASAEQRSRLIGDLDGLRARLGDPERDWLAAWTRWRLTPSWPPPAPQPQLRLELPWRALTAACAALGVAAEELGRSAAWRRLLSAEGGSRRERLRRWGWFLRSRPADVGRGAALGLAALWAGSAWPWSQASLGFAVAALAAAREMEGDRAGGGAGDSGKDVIAAGLRSHLARTVPTGRRLSPASWGPEWERALASWVRWARQAGM